MNEIFFMVSLSRQIILIFFTTPFVDSSSGSVTITDLPRRTIIIRAEGPQGELGWGAIVAGMSASLNIVLKGFNNPSSVDNKDFSAGLNGWEIAAGVDVSLVPHNEDVGPDTVVGRRRLQLDDDLLIGTGGVEGESSASHTFTSSEGACAFRVRYRFVTSEVHTYVYELRYLFILSK